MKVCLAILLVLFAYTATAASERSPDRFFVVAGFVPIDDGSLHVVLLMNDPVGLGQYPKYCGQDWSVGFVQSQYKNPLHHNVIETNPSGCWTALGQNPDKVTIIFRYFDITSSSIREFKIEAKRMHKMLYEWRTERIFPLSEER